MSARLWKPGLRAGRSRGVGLSYNIVAGMAGRASVRLASRSRRCRSELSSFQEHPNACRYRMKSKVIIPNRNNRSIILTLYFHNLLSYLENCSIIAPESSLFSVWGAGPPWVSSNRRPLHDEQPVKVVHAQGLHQHPPGAGLHLPFISRDRWPGEMPARRASWFWEMSSPSSSSHTAFALSYTRGAEEPVFMLPVPWDAAHAGQVRRGGLPMPPSAVQDRGVTSKNREWLS